MKEDESCPTCGAELVYRVPLRLVCSRCEEEYLRDCE